MSELMTQEEIDAMLNGTTTDTGADDNEQPADAAESVQESVSETTEEQMAAVEEPDVAAQSVEEELSADEGGTLTDAQAVDNEGTVQETTDNQNPDLSAPLAHTVPAAIPECLDAMETDALGEIGNICMGAAATALYTILGRKVAITTPLVECTTPDFLAEEYDIPFVIVDVQYTDGLVGNNLLILRVEDVKQITDIMMGGEGTVTDEDLSELHISAISEAMNQMMGGMSTAMADMLNRIVNISPPKTMVIELNGKEIRKLINNQADSLVKIGFKMEIEGIIDSGIMQLMPVSFARELVGTVIGSFSEEEESAQTSAEPQPEKQTEQQTATPAKPIETKEEISAQQAPASRPVPAEQNVSGQSAQNQQSTPPPHQPGPQSAEGQPAGYPSYPGWPPYPPYPGAQNNEQQGTGGQPYPPYPPYPPYGYPPYNGQQGGWQPPERQAKAAMRTEDAQIDAHPMQLDSFDPMSGRGNVPSEEGIDMIMDVPLQITVELGQCKKSIKEILDISVGSIITLDKVAGEPVDIVVNGKMIAKGEVIVIDDSYGVRITEIVSPSSRLKNIK